MKKIKFIAPLLAFALFSCDNYLDVNTSPNTLVYDDVTPALLLPGAQVASYRVQSTTMNQLGNVFMNSWTRNVQGFGNGFDRELQLTIDNSFYNGIWDGLYRSVNNFQGIIDYPNADGSQDYFVAIAKICKSHYLQYIVDLYGDAPYTEAFKGASNLTPAYDDDYAIYQSLITNLEEARAIIAAADPDAIDPTPNDAMLGGDLDRWVEFANTIELRILLRMSNLTGAQATYRDAKLATIVGGPFISDNVSINPGFAATTDSQMSPVVNTFFYNVAGENQQNRSFIAMTGHAWKSLQSIASTNPQPAGAYQIIPSSPLNYPNLTDPRSGRLFTGGVAGGAVGPRRAVIQGQNVVTIGAVGTTYPGVPSRLGAFGHIAPYGEYDSTPGLSNAEAFAGCDGFVMTYSEACFLLAEAAARADNGEAGYAGFTDAQTWFDEGIIDNFAFRNAVVGSYVATINTKPNFGYAASTTFDEKLHAIMYQKWVALMGIHGIESFVEYNRTGFPFTPLSLNATQTRKPYRLIYPVSEYVANSANVPSVTAPEAFTINTKTPFWIQ